jgi:hypothetical protein
VKPRPRALAKSLAASLLLLASCATACDDFLPKDKNDDEGHAGAPAETCSTNITRYVGHWARTCAQLEACYPDIQLQGGTVCRAPAVSGKINYPRLDDADLALIDQCLRDYSDREALEAWLCCQDEANEKELDCYRSCPEFGSDCAEKGSTLLEACNEAFDGNAQLDACFSGK